MRLGVPYGVRYLGVVLVVVPKPLRFAEIAVPCGLVVAYPAGL